MMMSSIFHSLVANIVAETRPQASITEGFTAGEFALIVAGGILTLAVLGFFIVLFIRASKETPEP